MARGANAPLGDATGRSRPLPSLPTRSGGVRGDGDEAGGRITVEHHMACSEKLSKTLLHHPLSDLGFNARKISFPIRLFINDHILDPVLALPCSLGFNLMPTSSKTELEALRQKQLKLVKKIKEAEAKTKKEQQEKDERRKLLAGAVALKELDANPSGAFADALLGMLKHHLTRAADRALFNLPALPKEPKPAKKSAAKTQTPPAPPPAPATAAVAQPFLSSWIGREKRDGA